jgi:hypothetical protein
MTTAIDRAAKAIYAALPKGGSRDIARAVLATTREPTSEMIDAGLKQMRTPGLTTTADYVVATWRAMHDAMMAEEKETND